MGFANTAFVVQCHGPGRMLAEFARKVPDTQTRYEIEIMERVSIELADAVVSPSAWLLEWMKDRRWPVPTSARVIPYIRGAEAIGESVGQRHAMGPVRRVAFFGHLREGKGIRIFLESLNALGPDRLEGIELLFIGRESRRWTSDAIVRALDPHVAEKLKSIRLETALERSAALAELVLPGTMAVMPSLLDNSPNTVIECMEHGVPFVAARTGGIPELIAEPDRERVLFEPTTAALARALGKALADPVGPMPAQPSRSPTESLAAWLELVETVAPPRSNVGRAMTRIDVVATDERSARRAKALALRTQTLTVDVVTARTRRAGLARATSDWVLFLDEDDSPDDELLETLARAQAASGADAVTCAVRPASAISTRQVFLGTPGPLGIVANQYGVIGVVRRSLLDESAPLDPGVDPDWLLFAYLALGGARIVAVPDVLSTHCGAVGHVGAVPGDGLAVLRLFETAREVSAPDAVQLLATLAAENTRLQRNADDGRRPSSNPLRRLLTVLRVRRVGGLLRRARARMSP
jgi:glycosyltransferase involved in cell wall biosynthesis